MHHFSKQLPVIALSLGLCLVVSGCLKTRITMDKRPSNETAELMWAHGFVFGLVPPVNAPLRSGETCGDAGVSEVYFRQTFVQLLAQGLTGSIYTPQRFTARCAAGGGMSANPSPPSYLLRANANDKSTRSAATASESAPTKKKRHR